MLKFCRVHSRLFCLVQAIERIARQVAVSAAAECSVHGLIVTGDLAQVVAHLYRKHAPEANVVRSA